MTPTTAEEAMIELRTAIDGLFDVWETQQHPIYLAIKPKLEGMADEQESMERLQLSVIEKIGFTMLRAELMRRMANRAIDTLMKLPES